VKKILIFEEKHCHRFFDASTKELKRAAALKILTERLKDGYWYDAGRQDNKPEPPDVPKYIVEHLPKGNFRDEGLRRWDVFEAQMKEYQRAVEFEARVKAAVKNKDGAAALSLLDERSDGQYEGFREEEIEEA
jgi:hypothetical protein